MKSYEERVEDVVFMITESLARFRPDNTLEVLLSPKPSALTNAAAYSKRGDNFFSFQRSQWESDCHLQIVLRVIIWRQVGRGEASRIAEYLVRCRPSLSAITTQVIAG